MAPLRRALVAWALFSGCALVACGSDDSGGAGEGDAAVTPDGSVPPDATVGDDSSLPPSEAGGDVQTGQDAAESGANDASDGATAHDASDASDASDATNGADAADASDAADAYDAAEAAADASDAGADAADASDASDASDAADASDAGNLQEAPILISAGNNAACAIDATGALKCWGAHKNSPQAILPGTLWREVSVGAQVCGIMTDNSLWCWNLWSAPSQPDTGTFTTVSAGYSHQCAISTTGALYCWGGSNTWGELGVGDTNSHPNLTKVGSAFDWAQVSSGENHTCALKKSGALYCWGQNLWGQLGNGSTGIGTSSPIAITPAIQWKEVAAGNDFTCAIRQDNTLYCWGSLMSGTPTVPTQVDTATDWASVTTGDSHVCALKTSGALYCFGGNITGALGDGTTTGHSTPERIGLGILYQDVAAGMRFTCARKSVDHTIWCWGQASSGQLGVGAPYGNTSTPSLVGAAAGWKSVSAAELTSCGVKTDGTIWCWGGSNNYFSAPSYVQTPMSAATGTSWKNVTIGVSHACVTQTDDTLYCWGWNSSGQCGVPSPSSLSAPNPTGISASQVALGGSHTCAITPAGALYCWGSNAYGQLALPIADGGTNTVTTPTQIGVATWKAVAADNIGTCAVRNDGTTWCWGNNNPTMTQIGSATTGTALGMYSTRYSVQGGGLYSWSGTGAESQVGSATDWRNVATGASASCGTKTGNTLWCWGSNYYGALADGTYVDHSAPAQAGVATTWSYATAAIWHMCGLQSDGSVYCWGYNDLGAVGDGTAWVTSPVQTLP